MQSTGNLLCASLMPRSIDELTDWLPTCNAAHMIELRLDTFDNPDLHTLRQCAQQIGKPWLAAVRTEEEGGFSRRSPEALAALLNTAADAGAQYLDVAYRYAHDILPLLEPRTSHLVLSHHTSRRNPAALLHVAGAMMKIDAGVYKLVFTAEQPSDTLTALHLCRTFAAHNKQYVVHALGGFGTPSRLIGAVRGNAWTYVARTYSTATGAGQMTIDEVRSHGLPNRRQGALLLGLLGYPTAHSKGRFLHNALLTQCFPGEAAPYLYLNTPTPDAGDFDTVWKHLFHGMSITLPHKERIVEFLDGVSEDVHRAGVCNTAVRRNGGWYGFNTDMTALRTLLAPRRTALDGGVLVIGTGGTARSAIAVLQQLGVRRIACTGRNAERGAALAAQFAIEWIPDNALDGEHFSAVIQATSLGMTPAEQGVPPAVRLLAPGMLALEVVYTPPETRFLRIARECGCTVISGVDMFLLQAIEQFRLFTGIAVRADTVRTVWNMLNPES